MFIKLYDSFEKVLYQKSLKELIVSNPKETQSQFNLMKFLAEAAENNVDLNKVDLAFSIYKINSENKFNIERIMVVDDEEIQLTNYKLFLARLGHYVEGFNSGEAALECFEKDPSRFTCIFTDNNMGGMNGCALSKKLKLANPHVKVWIITGELSDVDDDIFDDDRIEASISKPIRITTFVGVVGLSDASRGRVLSLNISDDAEETSENQGSGNKDSDEPPPLPGTLAA